MPTIELRSLFAAMISEATSFKQLVECCTARSLCWGALSVHEDPIFAEL
jgi:hypothetical protein